MPAYASATDREDEVHRPGLHLVVGRLYQEPPEFHAELTVDGQRFHIGDLSQVMEKYQCRRPAEVPADWIKKVRSQLPQRFYESARPWS
jgi:hypothetical protein